jgi:large subunit ribosomal protein L24
MANKFKKGDNVIVIAGSSKGKTGKILSIKNDKAVIEGVNQSTIHIKPTSQKPGEIKIIEKPINISNISHVENGLPIKIKFLIDDKSGGKPFTKKERISKKTGKKIN